MRNYRQLLYFSQILQIRPTNIHSNTAPAYMRELCPVHHPRRALRSSTDQWRLEPARSSNQYGDRSFRVLGRRLWNELPADIRGPITQATFRKHLKTFLFRQAYS